MQSSVSEAGLSSLNAWRQTGAKHSYLQFQVTRITDIPITEEREMLQQLNANVLHLLLFLVLISGSLSNAYSQQARGSIAASNRKEMLEDLHFKRGTKRFVMGGRKTGFQSTIMMLEKLKGHGPREKPSRIASAIRRKQNTRSLLSKEKEVAGFVAFNADYKGPRHHPPKNN